MSANQSETDVFIRNFKDGRETFVRAASVLLREMDANGLGVQAETQLLNKGLPMAVIQLMRKSHQNQISEQQMLQEIGAAWGK